jgi:hypothetical protein
MASNRVTAGCSTVAAMIVLFSSATVFADHLDRVETRRLVRQMEERSDALQDQIENWVNDRRAERERRGAPILDAADHLDQALAQFKMDLHGHDEPWDVRENAKKVIDAAAELGHTIEHGELRPEWEPMRDAANALARQYHLPELGR